MLLCELFCIRGGSGLLRFCVRAVKTRSLASLELRELIRVGFRVVCSLRRDQDVCLQREAAAYIGRSGKQEPALMFAGRATAPFFAVAVGVIICFSEGKGVRRFSGQSAFVF